MLGLEVMNDQFRISEEVRHDTKRSILRPFYGVINNLV